MRPLPAIFAAVLIAAMLPRTYAADPPNGITAVVHDSVITLDEVEAGIEQNAKRLAQFSSRPEQYQSKLNELRSGKLEELLDRQLILHEFKTAGYNLPESIVDELVQEEIRNQFRDRVTATKSLQEQGLTYEQFRQQLRDRFIITALRQKNISAEVQFVMSPYKIESYYNAHKDDYKVEDEVKLRMIVLTNASRAERVEMGQEIARKIRDGATFEEMAKIHSAPRIQAKSGSETFRTSTLRKELAEVVPKLKVGEVSDVIDTPEAAYLVLVDEAHPSHIRPLTEVREEIEKDLVSKERARLEKQWIERLKKKTFYRYF